FAGLYGVEEATAAKWEAGLVQPEPQIWERLRRLTLRTGSAIDEAQVRASPVYKYLAEMNDLTLPVVVSKGMIEALKGVGAWDETDQLVDTADFAHKSIYYEVSGTRALEIVQADPRWRSRDVLYAEVHCVAPLFGGIWVDGMIAPLRGQQAALI